MRHSRSDGAFVQDTRNGGWGFIIRDHTGEGIVAGAGRLTAVADALTAESLACGKALQSATDYGISRIQLEMDSLILKKALQSTSMDLAMSGIYADQRHGISRSNILCAVMSL